jgi:hypothetical protein
MPTSRPIDWQDLADALVEVERMAIAGQSGENRRIVTLRGAERAGRRSDRGGRSACS